MSRPGNNYADHINAEVLNSLEGRIYFPVGFQVIKKGKGKTIPVRGRGGP
jgi:hypothetical protein